MVYIKKKSNALKIKSALSQRRTFSLLYRIIVWFDFVADVGFGDEQDGDAGRSGSRF